MFDLSKLKQERNSNDWYSQETDGSELIIPGTNRIPDSDAPHVCILSVTLVPTRGAWEQVNQCVDALRRTLRQAQCKKRHA